jgi:hypothetical protein
MRSGLETLSSREGELRHGERARKQNRSGKDESGLSYYYGGARRPRPGLKQADIGEGSISTYNPNCISQLNIQDMKRKKKTDPNSEPPSCCEGIGRRGH